MKPHTYLYAADANTPYGSFRQFSKVKCHFSGIDHGTGRTVPSGPRARDMGRFRLIAVFLSANRSKGDRDPARWLPPNAAFHCEYVEIWVRLKKQWRLGMDAAEAAKVEEVLHGCNS